tara:strand:- start:1674 stop:2156 length:483 start_codon:yes stop_codon:yes gene_type:complete
MEQFISYAKKMNDAIMETDSTSILRNTKLIDKQLLTYFLYRIFCKNLDIFRNNTSKEKCNKILRGLKIPTNFDKCTPLSNKMPNDIKVINSIFNELIKLFEDLSKKQSSTGLLGDKKKIDYMIEYFETQGDMIDFKEKLILLSTLVPELGKMKVKSEENL